MIAARRIHSTCQNFLNISLALAHFAKRDFFCPHPSSSLNGGPFAIMGEYSAAEASIKAAVADVAMAAEDDERFEEIFEVMRGARRHMEEVARTLEKKNLEFENQTG